MIERPLRSVTLERYEYTLWRRNSGYIVRCQDTVTEKWLEHPRQGKEQVGMFTLEGANAMIESRIERHEELKR